MKNHRGLFSFDLNFSRATIMATIKDDNTAELSATKFNVGLMCGDCSHFKGYHHPNFDKPCFKLGISTKSEAPACFTPDVSALREISKDAWPMLAAITGLMTPKQSRVMMGLLKYAGSLERAGLHFLEKCYFCHTPADKAYLEDYSCGYALTMTRAGQVVIVGNDFLKASPAAMIAYLAKSSVLKEKEFKKRFDKCVSQGRIQKPQTAKAIASGVDYEVPTIDNEPTGETKKSRRRKANVIPAKASSTFSKEDLIIRT